MRSPIAIGCGSSWHLTFRIVLQQSAGSGGRASRAERPLAMQGTGTRTLTIPQAPRAARVWRAVRTLQGQRQRQLPFAAAAPLWAMATEAGCLHWRARRRRLRCCSRHSHCSRLSSHNHRRPPLPPMVMMLHASSASCVSIHGTCKHTYRISSTVLLGTVSVKHARPTSAGIRALNAMRRSPAIRSAPFGISQ